MKPTTRRAFVLITSMFAMLTFAVSALALDPGPDGWIRTGQGIRTKYFIKAKVYTAFHDMKSAPPAAPDNSSGAVWALKDAVVNMDVDKKIRLQMMRDVDAAKIRDAFNDAYDNNGYKGAPDKMANRSTFLNALNSDLKNNDNILFQYDSASKTTTLTAPNGTKASVTGVEFMKATWRLWFGHGAEQPDLGDQMLQKLIPQ